MGREILRVLLADETVNAVYAVGRRAPDLSHPKLHHQQCDFSSANLPLPPVGISEVYLALGSTIKTAGSKAAFRAIDYEANLNVALVGFACGAQRLGLVSAMGAKANSRVFYSQVKGELEQILGEVGYTSVVFARPSFLTGARHELGQPKRSGERAALTLMRWLRPVLPVNWRSVSAAHVAQALVAAVKQAEPGVTILRSDQLQLGE